MCLVIWIANRCMCSVSSLRLAVAEPRTEDYLMKLDEQYIFNRYKVSDVISDPFDITRPL